MCVCVCVWERESMMYQININFIGFLLHIHPWCLFNDKSSSHIYVYYTIFSEEFVGNFILNEWELICLHTVKRHFIVCVL